MQFIVPVPTDHEKLCAKIDSILKQLPYDDCSVEGLNSNIFGRIFVSLADTMVGICSTIKSNITNFNQALKRSELKEFLDSNRLKVSTIDKIDYSKMTVVEVDLPANLQGTYKNAVIQVAQCYLRLSTLSTAKMMETFVTKMFQTLTDGTNKTAELVKDTSSQVNRTVAASKQTVLTVQKAFSGEFKRTIKFEELFKTQKEFVDVRKSLLDLDPRLQEARTIAESIEQMEKTLKGITGFIGDNPDSKFSRDDMMRFGEMLKNVDLIFSAFGMVSTRHVALEHNYILIANKIYSICK